MFRHFFCSETQIFLNTKGSFEHKKCPIESRLWYSLIKSTLFSEITLKKPTNKVQENSYRRQEVWHRGFSSVGPQIEVDLWIFFLIPDKY